MKARQDEEIRGKIADVLRAAVRKSPNNAEAVARKLKIEVATLYKYMNGDMIPGGQVLWRACEHLGLILDRDGLRPTRRRSKSKGAVDDPVRASIPE